jgi:hypothetical protein
MKALILSSKLGFNKLHDELVPICEEIGLPHSVEHSQEAGIAVLDSLQPKFLFIDDWLPVKASTGEGSPKGKVRDGTATVSIPGLTGISISEAFGDVLKLVTELARKYPTLKIGVFYSSRAGMPKAQKEAYTQIPQVIGIFPYTLTQTTLAKFKKVLSRLMTAPPDNR